MKLGEHEMKFWRFYTSEVLYPLRFAEKHSDMAKYRPPVDLVRNSKLILSKKENVCDITNFTDFFRLKRPWTW